MVLQQLNVEMADAVARVRRSLVQVGDQRGNIGSGTIWRSDGLIITNAHVVAQGPMRWGKRQFEVTLADGQTFPAQIIAQDRSVDLAALSIEATDLPSITISEEVRPQPGEWVFGVGHPWGIKGAVTAGSVIDVGPSVEGILPNQPLIQVGLHLRPGHSGGPLVDAQGRLVGISTMINGPDVGLAIPLQTVQTFLDTVFEATSKPKRNTVPESEVVYI